MNVKINRIAYRELGPHNAVETLSMKFRIEQKTIADH